MTTSVLSDSFGRRFFYLRLSVTDACNFRCLYCLPNGYQKPPGAEGFLTLNEIANLVSAFSEMGTRKVRLTGGEPTLRRDLLEIVSSIKDVPGITKIALSTNGHSLKRDARKFIKAGIQSINVSVDTLDPVRFRESTGSDRLFDVLEGIDEALAAGFSWIKVNAVLMKDLNDRDHVLFTDWIKKRPITVRFIELMPTGTSREFFNNKHVSAESLRLGLLADGWSVVPRQEDDGPAQEFSHPNSMGRIGIIAPYAKDFCASCNRLRVTSRGALRLCLFGNSNFDLRPFLRDPAGKEELKNEIQRLIGRKEVSHYLERGDYGNNHTFSAMGG